LSEKLRRAYILGAGGEMAQFIANGQPKKWEIFCDAFAAEDRQFCTQLFSYVSQT